MHHEIITNIDIVTTKSCTLQLELLLQLTLQGLPEHTDKISIDLVLLAPMGIVDEIIVLGHWQTSAMT